MGEYLFDCLISTSLYRFVLPAFPLSVVRGKKKKKNPKQNPVDFTAFVRNNTVKWKLTEVAVSHQRLFFLLLDFK